MSPVLHNVEQEPPSSGRGVALEATEDRGVRSFGPILSPIGQLIPEEGACVTDLTSVSQVLHDVEQKPPSLGRRWR